MNGLGLKGSKWGHRAPPHSQTLQLQSLYHTVKLTWKPTLKLNSCIIPCNNMFKVNNVNNRSSVKIYLKLTIHILEECCFSFIFVDFDIVPMLLLNTYRIWIPPNLDLIIQGQKWKNQNNMRNHFKVDNKDTRTTTMMSFWCLYC